MTLELMYNITLLFEGLIVTDLFGPLTSEYWSVIKDCHASFFLNTFKLSAKVTELKFIPCQVKGLLKGNIEHFWVYKIPFIDGVIGKVTP